MPLNEEKSDATAHRLFRVISLHQTITSPSVEQGKAEWRELRLYLAFYIQGWTIHQRSFVISLVGHP